MVSRRVSSCFMIVLLLEVVLASAIMIAGGEAREHDLVVSWEDPITSERNHFENGTSMILNATVFNNGTSFEDVALQFFINGTGVLNSSRPDLAPGDTFWSAYFWSPSDADYCLTAYVPPVENETHTDNNNDTRWVRVCPHQPPVACFTYEPDIDPNIVLVGRSVMFNASCSSDNLDWGSVESYSWDFGDGTPFVTGTAFVVNHTFWSVGTFNVTLTVIDNESLEGRTSKMVLVKDTPTACFGILPGHQYGVEPPPYYVNDTLYFDASCSQPSWDEIEWCYWDFGDGNTRNETVFSGVQHEFASAGPFTVNLTVADNTALTDSYCEIIDVEVGFPIANFTVEPDSPYYVGDPLIFDASGSTDSDWGYIIEYQWDFGDSTLANETDSVASHTYSSDGEYTVTLIVVDNATLMSEPVNMTLQIINRVYLRVEPETVEVGPGETILSINVTIENVTDLEVFMFKLRWPRYWIPSSTTATRLLDDPIDAIHGQFLGDQDVPEGNRFNFRREIDPTDGYVWVNCTFFPDVATLESRSGSGTLVTINFTVATSGNCTLALTETTLNSTLGQIDHEVEHGYFYTTQPVANFSYAPRPVVIGEEVTFNASVSYDPDNPYDPTPNPIASYTWDFGDGSNDTGAVTAHTFTSQGPFMVNLTVTDDDGEKKWIARYLFMPNFTLIIEPCAGAFNESAGVYDSAGTLPINVTIINLGAVSEDFNITVLANNTHLVGVKTLRVRPGHANSTSFLLDSSSLPVGYHNLSATVIGVVMYSDYRVRVYLTGDVDRDCDTDLFDSIPLLQCYGFVVGDSCHSNLDLNCDGKIDLFDAVILAGNFGYRCP